MHFYRFQFLTACLILIAVGCSSGGENTYPVSGKVTFQGKPVTQGQVIFYPGSGRSALGVINSDGIYSLTTSENSDGAIPGTYRVTIDATKTIGGQPEPKSLEEELSGVGQRMDSSRLLRLVPKKYSRRETSTLKAEVEPKENIINFELD